MSDDWTAQDSPRCHVCGKPADRKAANKAVCLDHLLEYRRVFRDEGGMSKSVRDQLDRALLEMGIERVYNDELRRLERQRPGDDRDDIGAKR